MKHLLTVLMLFGLAMVGCDDDSASNNTNNVNNLNNTNNTNNVNNTNNINNINNTNNVNNLNCSPACEAWESCEDDGAGGTQCVALECTPACSALEVCLPHETEGTMCVALSWVHHPITISDPVVNGTSLMAPVDGISFGYNPEDGIIATSFGRDVDNAALTHLWVVHEDTGVHEKFPLTGDVFAETENFCNGEDWCQFISFDPDTAEYVVTGPLATGIMRVNALGEATMTTTSGPRPSNSNISYTYRFDWDARFLYVYGYLGPSDFGPTIHRMDLDSGEWESHTTGLPSLADNCIVHVPSTDTLYSFGGKQTSDGGETSQVTDLMFSVGLTSGNQAQASLPEAMGARASLSCAYVKELNAIALYGGNVINDHWNEIENEYFNEVWIYYLPASQWYLVSQNLNIGTFEPPDSYGDQAFVGDPSGPNLGANRGYMIYDAAGNRLLLMGAVPIFTHEQYYSFDLSSVKALLQ